MAHGFKTGGRQKGSLNKVTSEMKATIAATGETPLEYMLRVMRDENIEVSRRDDMAKAAAPFLHPRLASLDQRITESTKDVMRMPEPCATSEEWERSYRRKPRTATNSHAKTRAAIYKGTERQPRRPSEGRC